MQEVVKNLSFQLGVEQSIDGTALKDGFALDMNNISVKNGILEKTKGCSKWQSGYTAFNFSKFLKYNVGQTEILLAIDENAKQMYVLTDTNGYNYIANLTDTDVDYVNYQSGEFDVMVFTSYGDGARIYNRTDGTVKYLLKLGDGTNASDPLNRAPKGRLVEMHKERLWISGDDGAVNRLYFSKDFAINDWTTPIAEGQANQHGGLIDLPTFDGGRIVAMKSLFDAMLVFKTKCIFRIYGDYPQNFGSTQLYATVDGEIVDRTIQSSSNMAFFTSTEGIFKFDGSAIGDLTPRIKKEFAKYTKDEVKNSTAIIYKKQYIVAIKNKFIIYDITNDSFSFRTALVDSTKSVNDFVVYKDQLLYCTNGCIYIYDGASTLDGTPLIANLTGKMDNYSYTNKKKKCKQIDFVASGTATLEFGIITEKGRKAKSITLTSDEKHYRLKIKNRGYLIGADMKSLNGGDFTIKEMQIVVEIE